MKKKNIPNPLGKTQPIAKPPPLNESRVNNSAFAARPKDKKQPDDHKRKFPVNSKRTDQLPSIASRKQTAVRDKLYESKNRSNNFPVVLSRNKLKRIHHQPSPFSSVNYSKSKRQSTISPRRYTSKSRRRLIVKHSERDVIKTIISQNNLKMSRTRIIKSSYSRVGESPFMEQIVIQKMELSK